MTCQEIEQQVLELLVILIQAEGSQAAQQFLNDLVKIIEQYNPDAGISGKDTISWVDIRNTLESTLEQILLQKIAQLIVSYEKTAS